MGDLPTAGLIACPLCGGDRATRLGLNGGRSSLYRCSTCRVVHWGQAWGAEKAVEYYGDYYAKKFPQYDPITEKRYHAILDRFERLGAPGRLLDVGCGAGHFLTVAESRGWRPVGLEVSASGVEVLARLRAEHGWRFEVQGKDLLHADLPQGSFKAVTLFEVLEHLADPMANLRKIHALLEPGGLLYLTTPNFDSLSRYALGSSWRAVAREHLALFNSQTLRACLERTGFRPIRLLTKNMDVAAIVTRWRRRGEPLKSVETYPASRALRQTVEGSATLRWLKRGANAALRLSRLGETIETLAVKKGKRA